MTIRTYAITYATRKGFKKSLEVLARDVRHAITTTTELVGPDLAQIKQVLPVGDW
ncbi:hypothetical protein SXGG_00030 [Synechococcus phage S-CBP42]|uniref:Uncharacterized protein n=1 Tax=Synechococcus phage S-CBP42 TaxID=461711 RepID=G8EYE7_9CAUD|nr:hypothetical protein AVU76_gp38 [Synechococcus phage S-CBP42]AET72527.1 hypothetical protein SXGG_00030 [Synechococcus phage S-CBP42]AGK86689.1 hypothetical protein S-CBP42_0038 [Synechococcus phage S-CBP42]